MAKDGTINILLVEDSAADEMIIRHQLRKEGFEFNLTRIETLSNMKSHLKEEKVDIVLSDFRLPRFSGLAALQFVRENYNSLPFIIISGALGDEMAAEMIKKGANDFLLKDGLVRLGTAVRRALDKYELIQEKEEKEEMLELISYIISHDLRSPVNNASALIELVDEKELSGNASEIWPRIEQSVMSLRETLDKLVNITLTGKDGDEQMEKLRLNDVLEEVQADHDTQIVESKAIIRGEGLDLDMETNKVFLKSIFSNLVTNAIKYHHEEREPQINISAKLENNDKVILEVRDNGKGIDLDAGPIFQPFKRLTQKKSGHGLGLYITKKQVERLNGAIDVESRPDEGTIFKIELPRFTEKLENPKNE